MADSPVATTSRNWAKTSNMCYDPPATCLGNGWMDRQTNTPTETKRSFPHGRSAGVRFIYFQYVLYAFYV